MSNIYEALEQAQREKSEKEPAPVVSIPQGEGGRKKSYIDKTAPRTAATTATELNLDEEMFCLCQNIDFLLPDTPEKVLMFMGAQGAEGVSTIVREFARTAATRLNRSVLVMDAAHLNPTQHLHFNWTGGQSWRDVMKSGEPCDKACHCTAHPNIHIAPLVPQPAVSHHPHDHPAAIGFLDELQKKFDLILIDCSPATASPDSISMARYTDGVILVMEAERTRSQVVENIRKKIVRNGGTVLGIVLNKRKYHIPEFVYKRL